MGLLNNLENTRKQLLNSLLHLVTRFLLFSFYFGGVKFISSKWLHCITFFYSDLLFSALYRLPFGQLWFLQFYRTRFHLVNTTPEPKPKCRCFSHSCSKPKSPTWTSRQNVAHARSISCSGQPFPVRIMPPSTIMVSAAWASDFSQILPRKKAEREHTFSVTRVTWRIFQGTRPQCNKKIHQRAAMWGYDTTNASEENLAWFSKRDL